MGDPFDALIFLTKHPTRVGLCCAKNTTMHTPMASWHMKRWFKHPSNTSHAYPMHHWVPAALPWGSAIIMTSWVALVWPKGQVCTASVPSDTWQGPSTTTDLSGTDTGTGVGQAWYTQYPCCARPSGLNAAALWVPRAACGFFPSSIRPSFRFMAAVTRYTDQATPRHHVGRGRLDREFAMKVGTPWVPQGQTHCPGVFYAKNARKVDLYSCTHDLVGVGSTGSGTH